MRRAHEEGCSYFEAAKIIPSNISAKAKKSLKNFVDLILKIKSCAPEYQTENSSVELRIRQLLELAAEKSDYLGALRKIDSPEAESRIENIFELLSVAEDFSTRCEKEGIKPTLGAFLERASLSSDLDAESSTECVSLMTLHLAKGLEFDVVFLVGLEEGLLPHVRSMDDKSAIEEERRLCYVGITRAKQDLFLSYASYRTGFGFGQSMSAGASRFLMEIPQELLRNSSVTMDTTSSESLDRI
jgi:DNA helicase-2/ATP-dependent DNA helicase PcrA